MPKQELLVNVPMVITRGMFVFPGNAFNLEVGRPKSLEAIIKAQEEYDDYVFITSQKEPSIDVPTTDDIYKFGTLCKIRIVKTRDDGSMKVSLEGLDRAQAVEVINDDEMFYASVEVKEDIVSDTIKEAALVRLIAKAIEELISVIPNVPQEIISEITKGVSATNLSDMIGQYFPMFIERKQEMLEELDINKRLEIALQEIKNEIAISKIESNINETVQERINDNQKEFYLRERMRAIKEELGDTHDKDDEIEQIKKLVDENPFPEDVKEKIYEEIKKYEMMPQASSEANVVRTYLDWMIKIPWYQETKDEEDLNVVEKVLNDDHYGLDKVKERILEYLAVMKMTNSLKAPIICLVGPPGVGKTSIAKSIARSLSREFVKVSLGGVKDESEIRGHRRTYLGSMPGRIIQGMKKAGVVNPVFLLDEIDKMASDYKGDPASAMLEVLDPEQNSMFSDHYVEESYDLSKVMFIATANYIENIPTELKDRLEIIELSSYTELEKVEIAKNHLVKKQAEVHGLKKSQLKLNDSALKFIIQKYTKEAGVRQLERTIAMLARKEVINILKDEKAITLNKKNVEELLGKPRFTHTMKESKDQVGVVTGLAYTAFGGDILPIEVNYFKGKGRLVITGQLGDVMKESANIALDYVKANAKKYNIDETMFEKNDIHIHVPEGAVPKDGPSAGVTMTSAIISALTNRKAKAIIGMTGEVTLRGNVLPIGGLKEKSISAHRSGLEKIIIPKDNEKDIVDIPKEVQENLEIVLVDKVDQVVREVLV
ncbi:ATP-dependent Lon protease [Bacilli bacterium PM5-3]|nr:ATP-dependent Lon protease [Bacilli bacterium PM5-3]MDH6603940.1 ATP-dependent Lon protease [Bacilli bacterium PM5-9]